MSIKISIIVPVFNAMPYLTECLDSIASQKFQGKEIIIVDNGSSDGSLDESKRFAEKYDFIRIIRTHNASIGMARNLGMDNAEGDYVMFIDADDYIPDSKVLGQMYRKIVATDSDICAGNFSRLWGKNLLHAASHRSFSRYPAASEAFLFSGFFSIDILSYVWCKIYRLDFIRAHELYFSNDRYAEDKLFNLQAAALGAKYSFLSRNVYVHRHNIGSVSHTFRENPHLIWLNIAYTLKNTFKHNVPKTWWHIIAYILFFGCFFDSKMVYLHSDKSIKEVRNLLKEYGRDPLSENSFNLLSSPRNLAGIPSLLYRIFIGGFALCMRFHLYLPLSIGIKLLIDFKIDEILSDTGKKPEP